jgi:asparagine synthase (glutamine-hydrolysing)
MKSFVAEILRGDGPVRATGVANPREGTWIAGDVRLDGREELRDALGAAGVATDRAMSDTALVLAAWSAWRETATERLRGDFSFALWDHRDRRLVCARDPLGVRPLYWAQFGDAFVCASELGLVRAHPRATARLHGPAIVSFLRCGFNTDLSTTSFADVRRLPPAHQLLVRDDFGALTPRRYWSFPVPEPLRLTFEHEYVERYREVLGAAVRDRLRGNHAAILLSGGLDSTSLAATVRRVSPEVSMRAWTIDMGPSAPPDEVRLASSVASRLGLAHEVIREDSRTLSHLDDPGFRTPEPLDEPAWDSWSHQLRRISTDARTLIVGEDGDALFRPPGLLTMLRSWPAADVMRCVVGYTISHRRHPHLGIWLRRRLAAPFRPRADRAPAWIRRDVLARSGDPRAPSGAAHPTRPDAVRYLAHPVWQSVLESANPTYTGVELDMVWPFLDTRVIEFVFSIPPVPWCQGKELVRRAFRGELPDEILERPKSPLNRFFERQVATWRESRRPEKIALGDGVREFVDSRMVAGTLESGSLQDVSAAWRVLELDHWIRNLQGRERGGIT